MSIPFSWPLECEAGDDAILSVVHPAPILCTASLSIWRQSAMAGDDALFSRWAYFRFHAPAIPPPSLDFLLTTTRSCVPLPPPEPPLHTLTAPFPLYTFSNVPERLKITWRKGWRRSIPLVNPPQITCIGWPNFPDLFECTFVHDAASSYVNPSQITSTEHPFPLSPPPGSWGKIACRLEMVRR